MKTTKRALFSSVIALILCFSMLVGTTFAWFTDSVESGINTIVAGNLDVELYHTNKYITAKEKVDGLTDLFTVEEGKTFLWEPGAVAYEVLTVENKGTLALKYQLSVNFTNENTVNGYGLSQILKIAVVDASKLTSREAALAEAKAAENAETLHDFVLSGELNATDNTSKTYGIVIWWEPSDEDDKWNVNNEKEVSDFATTGKNELHIDLGIKLVATQVEGEFDSFGPDYDEDAVYTDFVVTSEEELVAALANAQDYAIIGIEGNVTWTTGAGIGSTPFIDNATTYSLKPAVKHITLLGLTEDATFTALGSGVGAVGIDGGVVTFKNLKIVDQSVSYAENSWEYGYLEFRGNTVFENCDIVNAIMMEGESASFKNCSFNSHKDSEYAVWVSNGDATFENCTFTGTRGLKMHEAYGSEVGTVVINNNTFIDLSKKPGLAIGTVNPATTVVLTNNEFIGTQAGDQGLYIYETDTDVTTFDFVCADNMVAGYADTNAELKDQLQNKATVILPEGEYTLPTLSGKEGITIIGAADGSTVVGGENTSTGFGGNFGKNTTIKNVTFSGTTNGVRYSYAQGGTTTFENCTFAGDSTYGFHIDESNGATFIFNNCTFIGFNAFAGDLEKIEFNKCTFLSNGNYGNTNVWNVAYYNNCTWGEGAGFDVKAGTEIYVDGVRAASNTTSLKEILAEDEDLVLMKDISFAGVTQMPDRNNYVEVYGNKTGFAQYGGVLDGNGKTLTDSEGDKSYVLVTHGGTIKNLTIKSGARGIVTYSPTEDVILDNVVVDGAGYALNSTEHAAVNMKVTNSTINGWTSLAGFKAVSFTNCKLGENSLKYWQGMGYGQVYDRLFRVYSPTTFTKCEFEQGYYLDMSAGGTATLIDCTVNGVKITADNYADYITIELPENAALADCVTFR